MPDSLSRDRLYPSLLDRLLDDEPTRATESRELRCVTSQQLRDNVLRDLERLFNATQSREDVASDDVLSSSVINYGLPALAGRPASQVDPAVLARMLREAILRFEPRLVAQTVKVRAERNHGDPHNVLGFRIEAQLRSRPIPLEIYMRTRIDLESGVTHVLEHPGS